MSLETRLKAAFERVAATVKLRGVPAGGAAGQVLTKIGEADYATGWTTPATGGGTSPRRSYLMYRLNITANAGGGTTSIAELVLRGVPGGPQIAAGGVASASSEFSADFQAAFAFDQVPETFWSTSGGVGTLTYRLPSSQPIAEYAVQAPPARADGSPRADQAPMKWTFEASNDGVIWYGLQTISIAAAWTDGEVRTFSLA